MKALRSFAAIGLAAPPVWGCTYNKQAIRPADLLQHSAGRSLVLLSTSSAAQNVLFAKAIVIFRVDKDGRRNPVITYAINSPWEQSDIPQDNTNLRWVALEPGDYGIEMGIMNPHVCFISGPEFYFRLGASQHAYLGNFHPDAASIHVSNTLERDVAYFQAHAAGADGITFTRLPLELRSITYGCKANGAPPVQVFMDR